MRIRLNLCALVAACLCSEVCFSQEFDSPAEPMTAAEIEATFSRLSALKQGLDPSDVFPDAWDSETQTNVSPQGGQSRDIKKVDFIELVVEELALTDQHLSQLLRDGVILRRMQSDFSFPAAYYSIYVRDLPLLVTTDSVLHAVHRSFDEIVDETESTMIQPVLIRMLDRMHSELAKIHDAGDADHLVDSLRDVDLYLTVARNLLEGRYRSRNGTLQPHISDKAAADAIVVDALAANQLDQLAIYGSKRALDYTQFKSLNRIDSFLTEFIGTANGISAMQLLELMSESGIEDINDCADAQKMQRLHARLAEVLGRLKVVRSEIGDTEERAAPVRFQLFSRRFAIDAYLLGQLPADG